MPLEVLTYPKMDSWGAILARPVKDARELRATVGAIISDVRERGDEALRDWSRRLDRVDVGDLLVSGEERAEAEALVDPGLVAAMELAHANIHRFHSAQAFHGETCRVAPGIECWQKSVPIEKVGLYVPGGTAPLFSTVLMLATPARIAGCREIALCTPPSSDGKVHPAVLVAARIAGVEHVYKVGGAQAIAAMAYGTGTVPRVHKIFGPGNQYVTCAKQLVGLSGVAIDFPAGPSEVMVLADSSSDPAFVASDLLSQAEHGTDSQALMLTADPWIVPAVLQEVESQLEALPRRAIAEESLGSSRIVILRSKLEMMEMANMYAPEHLIIETEDFMDLSAMVVNAGSVFLGHLTPESAGDYASGTNHTLPTNGLAAAYGGVCLDTFCRKVTFQRMTPEGVRSIAGAVEAMAEAESLAGHRNAMRLRRLSLGGDN